MFLQAGKHFCISTQNLKTLNVVNTNTRTTLNSLLQERNAYPERTSEIDRQIQSTFTQTCAVLVLDMSGFSRLTIRYGIIHFLAMVQRMCTIATPIVIQHQGRVIKQEADNLFAAFPDVQPAVDAAVKILQSFTQINIELPDDQDLYAGIGIGYGEMLVVADEDLYGNEMNLASKLGEDLARQGEILLTEPAFSRIQPEPEAWEEFMLSISGLDLMVHKLRRWELE